MVEVEGGRMLLRVQGGVETGFGWKEKLPDDWESTVIALIGAAKKQFGVSSGQRKEGDKT